MKDLFPGPLKVLVEDSVQLAVLSGNCPRLKREGPAFSHAPFPGWSAPSDCSVLGKEAHGHHSGQF